MEQLTLGVDDEPIVTRRCFSAMPPSLREKRVRDLAWVRTKRAAEKAARAALRVNRPTHRRTPQARITYPQIRSVYMPPPGMIALSQLYPVHR